MSLFFLFLNAIFVSMSGDKIHVIGKDAIIVGDKSMASITGISGIGLSDASIAATTKKESKDPKDITKSKPWSIWGDSDSWPNDLMEILLKLGVARSALDINSDFHYGSGIQWMKEESVDGKISHVYSNPDNWRNWAFETGFNTALSDSINSRDTFGIGFIRVIMSKNKKIFSFDCLDTQSCRLSLREKNGKIKYVFYDFDIANKNSEEGVIKLPIYHPDQHDDIIAENEFVFVVSSRTWGRFYYPEPNYYATIRNGWADVALEVPKLIKNIYKNQATLKYHIKIPLSNLQRKYKCWDEKTQEEQLLLFAEYKREIDSVIAGAEAAGKSVFSLHDDGGSVVEIIAIDNVLKTTNDLPNNIAANSEILFAIGIAPSIIGLNMPGGKDLNGSGGSQLRESIKAKQSTLTRERISSLEFCYLVKRIMKWPEEIYPAFVDIDVSQTLDENPTGKRAVVAG